MATRIKDEKGSVLWGPNTFGSYTIEQIQVVTKIFEDLLKNLSLKVENVGENVHKDIYTKEESNTLFILKTDFNSLASDLVKALVNNYIQEQASTAGLAAAADVRTLEKVANYLTKTCFNQTYTEIKDVSNLNINPLVDRVFTLETKWTALDTNTNHLMADIYELNPDGSYSSVVKFFKKSEAKAIQDKLGVGTITSGESDVITALNNINVKINTLNTLAETVRILSTSINNLTSRIEKLENKIGEEELDARAKVKGYNVMKFINKVYGKLVEGEEI